MKCGFGNRMYLASLLALALTVFPLHTAVADQWFPFREEFADFCEWAATAKLPVGVVIPSECRAPRNVLGEVAWDRMHRFWINWAGKDPKGESGVEYAFESRGGARPREFQEKFVFFCKWTGTHEVAPTELARPAACSSYDRLPKDDRQAFDLMHAFWSEWREINPRSAYLNQSSLELRWEERSDGVP